MNMQQSVRTVLSKYATFEGRAPRSEYWWWVLFFFILSALARFVDAILIGPLLGFDAFAENAGQPLGLLIGLALLLPSIAVSCRRLHDIGRSGWWLLIGLVPLIGGLVLLYWYVQPSDPNSNEYG
ncbi:MAG: DUF805 domain-containing protein [Rhizobiaceae bacterium]